MSRRTWEKATDRILDSRVEEQVKVNALALLYRLRRTWDVPPRVGLCWACDSTSGELVYYVEDGDGAFTVSFWVGIKGGLIITSENLSLITLPKEQQEFWRYKESPEMKISDPFPDWAVERVDIITKLIKGE